MFEAIHGSAPRRAGQNVANPSGLLHGAILMLNHLGQFGVAERVHNAWLKTLEDGIHTYDIYTEGLSRQKVGTREFADAVIANLGQEPSQLQAVRYRAEAQIQVPKYERKAPKTKELEGVDLFVHWPGTEANELAPIVQALNLGDASLSMITNRGIKVWPDGFPETFCTDHWRCRFKNPAGGLMPKERIAQLLQAASAQGIDVVKTENLYRFNGVPGYSLGQGQ
jgi:isocitrate dehydrogenase